MRILFPCTPLKAKKFLNNCTWVVVLLPESCGLEMQEHFPDGEAWLGGSCVPLATSLSPCWFSLLRWLCWASHPRNPSVNWIRETIQLKVLASLSGGRMGKEKAGVGCNLLTANLPPKNCFLSVLWRPDVLAGCDEGINGGWERGAFLHWVDSREPFSDSPWQKKRQRRVCRNWLEL